MLLFHSFKGNVLLLKHLDENLQFFGNVLFIVDVLAFFKITSALIQSRVFEAI